MADATADDSHYIAIMRRVQPAMQAGAAVICLLIIGSTWGRWTEFATAIAIHAVVYPMNIVHDRLIVPRFGSRAEVLRALFNTGVGSVGYTLIGWPVAVWLWLPYAALSWDQSGRRHSIAVVVTHCLLQSVVAIVCGVPLIYPIAFSAFAVVTWQIAGARLAIIREMWLDAEQGRAELARAHEELKTEVEARHRMELELRQAQKLEAMGRLAAGVAHEINTPMQFIGDNLTFVTEGVTDLLALAEQQGGGAGDLAYLKENMPEALAQATEGVKRVSQIVSSMKQFTHYGNGVTPVDVKQAVRNTLTLASHEYRLVADIETRFADLPPVSCNAGEINQVLLNIVVNAGHAIADRIKGSETRGRITIETSRSGEHACISISDTGNGIPAGVRDHMFEPFFTTKDVGRGTGQGLAIAKTVVERHGGALTFETVMGQGTTFVIKLPFDGTAARNAMRAASANPASEIYS